VEAKIITFINFLPQFGGLEVKRCGVEASSLWPARITFLVLTIGAETNGAQTHTTWAVRRNF
jgi:hypothetical protein